MAKNNVVRQSVKIIADGKEHFFSLKHIAPAGDHRFVVYPCDKRYFMSGDTLEVALEMHRLRGNEEAGSSLVYKVQTTDSIPHGIKIGKTCINGKERGIYGYVI